MTTPTWITPAGDIFRTVSTTSANGLIGSTVITVANSANIDFNQWVFGNRINPGTTVTGISGNQITISSPITADIDIVSGLYTFSTPLFIENNSINVSFTATPANSNNYMTYSLLAGNLPSGNLTLTSTGNVAYLTGTLANIAVTTTSRFTIRAVEQTANTVVGISDRSFSMTVVDNTEPYFTTRSGVLYNQQLVTGNVPAPLIANIYLSNITVGITAVSNAVTISTTPYNLAAYNLSNGSMIYFGGIGGVSGLNNNQFYLGNANTTANTFIVYTNSNLSTPLTKIDNTDLGTYTPNTGTVATTANDCVYFSTQLTAVLNDPGVVGTFTLNSGSLPPGLELGANGLISGYPTPPVVGNTPIANLSQFEVKITTASGSNVASFSIPVINQQLAWTANNPNVAFPGRAPSILNKAPLTQFISANNPYYPYYFTGNSIGTFTEDNVLQFKFIGYNWNATGIQGSEFGLTYTITGLSAGSNANINAFTSLISPNSGNIATDGWINGTLANLSASNIDIKNYTFTVSVANGALTSSTANFTMTVTDLSLSGITWNTDSNLGAITTGDTSSFSISASADPAITDIIYVLSSGSLPPNLQLLPNGDIVGKVALQPGVTIESLNTQTTYSFTVEAYSERYRTEGITSERTFTITTIQKTTTPWDNLYMVALLSDQQRGAVDQLLATINTTQSANIYRPADANYGVSKNVKYVHMYGVIAKNSDDFYPAYIEAIKRNHYYKNLTLGPLQTARALNSAGQVVYEVIYSPIIDNLVNKDGVSVSKSVYWQYPIVVDGVNLSQELFPNSLDNMRKQIESTINLVNTGPVLPLWMTSLQTDGVLPGYVPCWVVCYCKPGTSDSLKTYINSWLSSNNIELNDINFGIDRFEVDRSLTYTWGTVESYAWPAITGEFYSGNANILLNSTTGLTINQGIQFSMITGPLDVGAGTISITTTSSVVTGVGTSFTGALVNTNLYNSEYQTIGNVQSVANSTSLTLYANANVAVTGGTYYTDSSTTPNIQSNTTYYITELRPQWIANGTLVNSIKVRANYIGSSANVITPNFNGKMAMITQPLSASVPDNSQDSYVFFDQQTILRK